jgi:hypothetical protein
MAVALDSFGWFLGFYNLMIPALQRYGYGVGRPLSQSLETVLSTSVWNEADAFLDFSLALAYEQGKRIEFEISLPLIRSSNAIRAELALGAKR